MLHRYTSLGYIFELDLEPGLELILKAMEQDRDERLFRQWTAQLPIMALGGTIMGFDDYKAQATGANIDRRSTAEILAELEEVEEQFRKGG